MTLSISYECKRKGSLERVLGWCPKYEFWGAHKWPEFSLCSWFRVPEWQARPQGSEDWVLSSMSCPSLFYMSVWGTHFAHLGLWFQKNVVSKESSHQVKSARFCSRHRLWAAIAQIKCWVPFNMSCVQRLYAIVLVLTVWFGDPQTPQDCPWNKKVKAVFLRLFWRGLLLWLRWLLQWWLNCWDQHTGRSWDTGQCWSSPHQTFT